MSNTDQGSPVALVTGSGRGIGLACARALAADGHDVCLNCSSDSSFERTNAAAEEIAGEYGVRTLAVVANVADTEAAKALVDQAGLPSSVTSTCSSTTRVSRVTVSSRAWARMTSMPSST